MPHLSRILRLIVATFGTLQLLYSVQPTYVVVDGGSDGADEETKIYALHFPQFHSDRYNNKLWGNDFTEWTNLKLSPELNRFNRTIARPTELGYYNLLNITVRRQQRELAGEYGVDGFIYHHYWFYNHGDKPAPLSGGMLKLLDDGEPAIPFAFNWAKESWVRTWHGRHNNASAANEEVLVQQLTPSANDARIQHHYDYLRRFFHHPLYIKVNGAPFFQLYSPEQRSTDTLAIVDKLRQLAIADGFPPPGLHVPTMRKMSSHPLYTRHSFPAKLGKKLLAAFSFDSVSYYPFADAPTRQMHIPAACRAGEYESGLHREYPSYVGVNSVFDNTPRRSAQQAHIIDRSTFHQNLSVSESLEWDVLTAMIYERCCQPPETRRKGAMMVMINAWNEWGEGMVLEPSDKYGRSLLVAVKNAKAAANRIKCNFTAYNQHLDVLQKV